MNTKTETGMTEGEWKVEKDRGRLNVVAVWDGWNETVAHDLTQANARAIAMLPDLMAAAEATHRKSDLYGIGGTLDLLAKALAKAKGESDE